MNADSEEGPDISRTKVLEQSDPLKWAVVRQELRNRNDPIKLG